MTRHTLAGRALSVAGVSLVLCGMGLVRGQANPGQNSPSLTGPGLGNLAWMAGPWRGQQEGAVFEEHWSAPQGNCIMGMFRLVKNDRLRFAELMLIEQTDDGLLLTLKHFGPGMEDLDRGKVLVFRLVRAGDGEAIFQRHHEDAPGPRRIIYRLVGDVLHARLEPDRPGEEPLEFHLKRLPDR